MSLFSVALIVWREFMDGTRTIVLLWHTRHNFAYTKVSIQGGDNDKVSKSRLENQCWLLEISENPWR